MSRMTQAAFSPYVSFHSANKTSSGLGVFFCDGYQLFDGRGAHRDGKTYARPGLQVARVDRVLVEAVPLLEGVLGQLVRLLGVPVEHAGVELEPDGRAVLAQDALRVVEQVVGIDDANLQAAGRRDGAVVLLPADLGADESGVLAVVEEAAELVVASLFRHELVETGLLDERRHAAAVIARDGVAWVADKEGEVELLEQLPRHDRRVVRLGGGVVREGCGLGRAVWHDYAGVSLALDLAILATALAVGADATLGDAQRRSDARGLLVRRDEVVSDVFDEDTFALVEKVSVSCP